MHDSKRLHSSYIFNNIQRITAKVKIFTFGFKPTNLFINNNLAVQIIGDSIIERCRVFKDVFF